MSLTDLAAQMQNDYEDSRKASGARHESGEAVHQFLKQRRLFKWYSSLRCATQELVWQSVLRAIESDPDSMTRINERRAPKHGGSLELNDAIAMPDYAEAMDVHLMPGNYQGGLGRRR